MEKRDAQVGSFEGGTTTAGVISAFTRLVTAAVPDLLRAAKVRAFPGLDPSFVSSLSFHRDVK